MLFLLAETSAPGFSKESDVHKKVSRFLYALMFMGFCGIAVHAADDGRPAEDKKPTFELKDIAFKGFDLSNKTADIIATVEVKNLNGGFKLTDVQYKFKLNDNQLAEGRYEKELEIPASGEVLLELPFTVDMTAIPGVAWSTITDSLRLRYELEAEFTVPIFAALKHTQKSSFKGDLPLGEAFTSLSNKLKEKLFGKP
jgi:LEA14-like dessication related protein